MGELTLELAAELGERRMLELESLEDDRRAALELLCDPLDPSGSGERGGRPRNVLRVVADDDLRILLDDPEPGMPEASGRDAPLDLGARQEVEEAPLLVARDEEGLPLPVLTEEALGFDG
jgi:hypothetical protein